LSRQPIATVRVLTLPHIAPDAVRIEIDCRYSTTGLTSVPGPAFSLTRPQMITAAVFEHEARCIDCDTSEAHEQGDQAIREATECAWNEVRAAFGRRYADGVRN
jgi:hypothetical protein